MGKKIRDIMATSGPNADDWNIVKKPRPKNEDLVNKALSIMPRGNKWVVVVIVYDPDLLRTRFDATREYETKQEAVIEFKKLAVKEGLV